jgi:hypothetical protein
MTILPTAARYRATSMELAVYLDGHYVEMRILTDTGKAIDIACDRDSIFALQRHIEQIGRECPQISTWKTAAPDGGSLETAQDSNEAARSEGWPAAPYRGRPSRSSETGAVAVAPA